jgi:DNA-binding CsgD family transcriptional regulator
LPRPEPTAALETFERLGARLFMSSRTVENHVSAILTKPGAASRLEALALAERLGIIS